MFLLHCHKDFASSCFGVINYVWDISFIAFLRITIILNSILLTVSKMWAKKNAVGKEQVAKLVDDTYRFVF